MNQSATEAERDQQAWADSVGVAIDRVVEPVEGMHRAISDPWLRRISPGTADLHGRWVGAVYKSVRAVLTTGAATTGAVTLRNRNPLRSSQLGLSVRAFSNGVWGDHLERQNSPAHIQLGLRDDDGRHVSLDRGSLGRAFPDANNRIAVLLHGLGQTESKWRTRTGKTGPQQGIAGVVEQSGFTPLLLRYNSGLHVPHSGADLADLLEELCEAWPVPVREIALVGFSMGGLVARSAIHAGHDASHAWTRQVTRLVTLATPHLGSPIEKGANVGSLALRLTAKTKPLGDFVDTRSQGIKDLRHGTVVEGGDVGDRPLPAGIEQHFLAGVTTANPHSPIGRLVGDFVVRPNSGTGRGATRHLDPDNVRVIEGVRHTGLFHNPEVHRQVADWLGGPPTTNS